MRKLKAVLSTDNKKNNNNLDKNGKEKHKQHEFISTCFPSLFNAKRKKEEGGDVGGE